MKPIVVLAAAAMLLPAATQAQNGQVVGPNGVVVAGAPGNWSPDIQAGAYGQVTTTNGRCGYGGYCAGSLELSVTGNPRPSDGQYPDWAFYYDRNGGNQNSFGSLAALDRLAFDWYRMSDPTWNTTDKATDWPYKTPVLRVTLADGNGRLADLVWEGYYNRAEGEELNGAPTPVDQWITSANLQNGNFWVNLLPTSPTDDNRFLDASCQFQSFDFWHGGVPSFSIDQLVGPGGCLADDNEQVVGIAVGVGSQWPLPYHAFVDNVQMGFEGSSDLAVDTNFDVATTAPEPATWVLMATGLLAVGGVARRRRALLPKA